MSTSAEAAGTASGVRRQIAAVGGRCPTGGRGRSSVVVWAVAVPAARREISAMRIWRMAVSCRIKAVSLQRISDRKVDHGHNLGFGFLGVFLFGVS